MPRKLSLNSFRKSADYQASNRKLKASHAKQNKSNREIAIDNWYKQGGDYFLQWVKDNYTLYSGDKLVWNEPFLEDYYRLLGEPRVRDLYIEKGSQMGYTESLIAFSAFFLAELKLPLGFGFETFLKQRDMVGSRVQLAFSHCQAIQKISESHMKVVGRKDTDTKDSITIGGTKATFFYAGTNKSSGTDGSITRQASSRLSSFSACAIIADEVELWDAGILDISRRRMDATILPSEILRAGSTPGHEGGLVDVAVKSSDYIFQWHVTCPSCSQSQPISAFGNLLKGKEVLEEGKVMVRYLDKGGRPLDWFYSDDQYRQDSAYVGCRHCGSELTKEAIASGGYKCVTTGKTIQEFFIERRESPDIISRVALRMPKLALAKFDAILRIKELFSTDNPADCVQQGLGVPFTLGSGKIQLEVLLECVGLEIPEKMKQKGPDLVVMGLDQGKYSNHVIISAFYLADEPTKELKWRNAHKEILWWGNVDTFEDLDPLIEKYKVLIIGIDSEPEWSLAAEYCFKHPPKGPTVISIENYSSYYNDTSLETVRGKYGGIISGIRQDSSFNANYWLNYSSGMSTLGQVYLFDQVNFDKVQYKRNMRNIKSHSSRKIPCFSIDRTFWLDMVRDRIYLRNTHYPTGTTYDPKDKNNLLYQYLTSDRLVSDRKWIETGNDHYFHADCFMEAACFISMFENGV